LDSGPNNFTDISLVPDFAGICGFTFPEIDRLFKDRFARTLKSLKAKGYLEQDAKMKDLKEAIRVWYDGYNWLGPERVLNPYSILNLFKFENLSDFWPLSGQPSHISDLAKEKPLDFIQPSLNSYPSRYIRKVELGRLEAVPVLFHSGYLTIDRLFLDDIIIEGEPAKEEKFTFKIPNREVALDYKAFCFQQIFDKTHEDFISFSENLRYSLHKKDSEKMAQILSGLLFGIVHRHHEPDESFYHSMFQTAFIAAGLEAISEREGSRGNSDIAIILDGRVRVVTELKYVQTDEKAAKSGTDRAKKELAVALDKAENAIKEKNYAGPFKLTASEIICLALAVRGRDEVAVRFLTPDEPDDQPAL
jgi:hypothetical protein